MKKMLTALCCMAIALALLSPASLAQEPQATPESEKDTKLLEAFTQLGLDLMPYEGKAILLNFFTEWCPYCELEMPYIKQLFDTYSRDELEIIMVHVWDGEDERNTESVKERYSMQDMHFFEDRDRALYFAARIPGFPTSVFINKDGKMETVIPQAMNFEMIELVMERLDVGKKDPNATPQGAPDLTAPPPTRMPLPDIRLGAFQ